MFQRQSHQRPHSRRLKSYVSRALAVLCLSGSAYVLSSGVGPPPEQMQVGTMYGSRVLVTTNQLLNPAGRRVSFAGRPLGVAVSPSGEFVVVLLNASFRLHTTSGNFLRSTAIASTMGGIAFEPGGGRFWISELTAKPGHRISAFDTTGAWVKSIPLPAQSSPCGIAIDPLGRYAYIALNLTNELARVDLTTEQVSVVPVGMAPLAVALAPDGRRVYVANQGGFRPGPGERTASSAGSRILIDERGIARSGSMSVVDTATFQVIAEAATGLLPTDVLASPDGSVVAVTNGNSDSVSLFRADTLETAGTVSFAAMPSGAGSGPAALAFAARSSRLYVACAGNNAVAVLSRTKPPRPGLARPRPPSYQLTGFLPTDWYPMALATGTDGTLYVANVKGIGTRNAVSRFGIGAWMGTLNVISAPNADAALSSDAFDANQPFRNAQLPPDSPADLRQLGIQHVFLIVKENRTYDQVLGDLGFGNGDPSLTLYGWRITPNHHRLAATFTTLDNFFTSGTVSADGHQWLMQSIVTPYLERAHGSYPRSYPFSGEDPLAFSPTGFLWTNAQEHGRTVRMFGEYTQATSSYSAKWIDYLQDAAGPMRLVTRSSSPIAALNPLVEPEYPSFALNVPDVFRARIFLEKFRQFEANASLPNLVIVQLPTDHTVGVTADSPTPNAMLADNDLAVGRIVEAISRSSYWPKSAVFVVEDDAQDGVDHVDGHRTLCLVASPYTRRAGLDSTHYNQTSVVRTIEELLGLPPMNKFDAAALPMRSVFTVSPDYTPYTASENQASLNEMVAAASRLRGDERVAAAASARMNFSVPDAAPEEELNRILWHYARGWRAPYPRVPHRPDCPPDKD